MTCSAPGEAIKDDGPPRSFLGDSTQIPRTSSVYHGEDAIADFATENLAYFEGNGLVYLRPHGDADDEVCIGGIDSILACPREYRGEFRSLRAEVREARLFDAACRSEAGAAYYGRMDPWRW